MTAHRAVTLESDARRLWAAVRFVDARSSRTIETPLQVEADGLHWVRNRSGLHIALQVDEQVVPADERPPGLAAQLAAYEGAFDPLPAVPALQVNGRVADPAGRFVARTFSFPLPRAQMPSGIAAERFTPVEVLLQPAPADPTRPPPISPP